MNEISILVIGDPHIKTSNIPEVDLFIKNVTQIAAEKKPTLIVCLGDTLDTMETLHTIALNKAIEFINAMRKISPLYILVGNHDMCNCTQFLTKDHWMNFLKEFSNVVVIDTVVKISLDWMKIVFAPYVPPGRFIEALDTLGDEKWMDSDCIFAHQEIKGCILNSNTSTTGDVWHESFPPLISGHIHMRQRPYPNVYYVGSTMQHDFGDIHSKFVDIIKFSPTLKKDFVVEEFDLNLPQKIVLHKNIEEIATFSLEKKTNDKIKIALSGSAEEHKTFKKSEKYKELVKEGVVIAFKRNSVAVNEVLTTLNESTSHSNIDFNKILCDLIAKENYSRLSHNAA